MRAWVAAAGCLLLAGCTVLEIGVTNPVPGLTTVAVTPFLNLSQEPSVDGRRFALAYYAELQKVPGFQVIPVGVAEHAILEHQLSMNDPTDVLRLAELLKVDAVVVGGVTDYDPYYPPRVGLQVSWYSPRLWTFAPGMPLDPGQREALLPQDDLQWTWSWNRRACPPSSTGAACPPPSAVRGQSVTALDAAVSGAFEDPVPKNNLSSAVVAATAQDAVPEPVLPDPVLPEPERLQESESVPMPLPALEPVPALEPPLAIIPLPYHPPAGSLSLPRAEPPLAGPAAGSEFPAAPPFDPRQPLMSYTRMFDGSDARVVAKLRDYVELSGDLRSGGWEAYLQRSEDFIRFTAHAMIVEMLQLHGGETHRRYVWKMRKHR